MSGNISELFDSKSLIPVVVIEDAGDAVPLAKALLAGGIKSIEITLRTPAGLDAIKQVAQNVPEIITGAGTVLNISHMQKAKDAGASFQVSPGFTDSLAEFAKKENINWLPGVTAASGIMQALDHGFETLKFFPASLSGGVPMLKQFNSVFSGVKFCPTGGISLDNMNEYASLENVFAIGGSWLTPKSLIEKKSWDDIKEIASNSSSRLIMDYKQAV